MSKKYWGKLYTKILDDPKMTGLSDRLFRRTIELFLLAGKLDQAGALPDTQEIAWRLRTDSRTMQTDLEQVAQVGIIEATETGWLVTNFAAYQAWSYGSNFGPGYVYVFQRPSDGAYKIGLSRQPQVRLVQVRENFPGTELIHLIKTDDMQVLEGKLHSRFVDCRLDGEWFNLDDETIEILKQVREG